MTLQKTINYRFKDTLANKQKAIFINNILIDMHSHSFFNSTQLKTFCILFAVIMCKFIYLLVYAMYQEYDQ